MKKRETIEKLKETLYEADEDTAQAIQRQLELLLLEAEVEALESISSQLQYLGGILSRHSS